MGSWFPVPAQDEIASRAVELSSVRPLSRHLSSKCLALSFNAFESGRLSDRDQQYMPSEIEARNRLTMCGLMIGSVIDVGVVN